MAISETKMKIVIDNYFKAECNVNTSIRDAFEKGFRIGVQKGYEAKPERKKGEWKPDKSENVYWICSACGFASEAFGADDLYHFCPNCGADMRCDHEDILNGVF